MYWRVMTKIIGVFHCIAVNDGQFGVNWFSGAFPLPYFRRVIKHPQVSGRVQNCTNLFRPNAPGSERICYTNLQKSAGFRLKSAAGMTMAR